MCTPVCSIHVQRWAGQGIYRLQSRETRGAHGHQPRPVRNTKRAKQQRKKKTTNKTSAACFVFRSPAVCVLVSVGSVWPLLSAAAGVVMDLLRAAAEGYCGAGAVASVVVALLERTHIPHVEHMVSTFRCVRQATAQHREAGTSTGDGCSFDPSLPDVDRFSTAVKLAVAFLLIRSPHRQRKCPVATQALRVLAACAALWRVLDIIPLRVLVLGRTARLTFASCVPYTAGGPSPVPVAESRRRVGRVGCLVKGLPWESALSLGGAPLAVRTATHTATRPDGSLLPLLEYRPQRGASTTLAGCLVFYHGGGWAYQNTHDCGLGD